MARARDIIILVFLFVRVSSELENCNRHVSFGYGYKDFFALTNEIMRYSDNALVAFEFHVKTSSDAHVLLTNEVAGNESIEIVIGGGSNTFSQIRMIKYGDRKIILTEKTDSILSSSEFKKFDILIDKEGIITVQLEQKIFLNWKLDDLFPIRYVAFGSWTNTKAEWRFACNSKGALPDKARLPPPPLSRLKSHLLYGYNPNTLPVDAPDKVNISADLKLERFFLNEKHYQLTVRGMAFLKWKDKKLTWKPEDYDGIQNIFLPSFQVWTPFLMIVDGPLFAHKPLVDAAATGVEVTHKGLLFWRPPFEATFYCYLNMTNWPYDSHNCSALIGFQNEPENLLLTFEETNLQPDNILKQEAWRITEVKMANEQRVDSSNDCGMISVMLERIHQKRNFFIDATASHIVAFVALWWNVFKKNRALIYLAAFTYYMFSLYFKVLQIVILPRDVPEFVIIYSYNIILLLISPVLYSLWTQIPSAVLLPEWLAETIFCLRGNQQNYNAMNRGNKNHMLFPLKKMCWFSFMLIHASLIIFLNACIYKMF